MRPQVYGIDYLEGRLRQLASKEIELHDRHLESMERNKGNDEVYWAYRIMAAVCLGKVTAYNELREKSEKGEL